MKIISKISRIVPIIMLVLIASSCSDDDQNTTDPIPNPLNIVETASATSDLSSLVAAVTQAGLVDTLNGSGPFTVLAPTNAAFESFLNANGFSSLSEVPNDLLKQILLNHVITGSVPSSALTAQGSGYANTNADGVNGNKLSIYFNTENGVRFNNVSSVSNADVTASNGIVHIVDAVIGLPTVVTFATADPNFSSLVAALTEDGQPDFVSTLSTANGTSPAPFTVFAPINAAFQALLDSNSSWNSLSDIDTSLLTNVLQHHVIAGANVTSGDLTDGVSPEMLNGENITINLPGNDGNPAKITDGNGTTDIDVIAVDVQATNGVIHAIESVLLPNLD